MTEPISRLSDMPLLLINYVDQSPPAAENRRGKTREGLHHGPE
jgi:hypothetical protein